jgi:ArsR family transcriptional regulator
MQELIRISKALSDETRIRMLRLLLERDVCLCEMQEIFPISQSQVSRNLKMLMDAGFLKRWREGKCVVYIANRNSKNQYCQALLDVLANSFSDDGVVSVDREKLKQAIDKQVRKGR